MILTILKKELKENFRDGKFFVTFLFILLLLLASSLTGWKYNEEYQHIKHEAQESQYKSWLNKGEMNAHTATHHGTYIFRDVSILNLIDKGLDKYIGTTLFIESHKQNQVKNKASENSNQIERFGELTVSVTMQILIPLLIIILTFNSITFEKENGTFKQIMSIGVPKHKFIMGKLLSILVIIASILIPVTAFSIGVVSLQDLSNKADLINRILLLNFSYFLYFLIYLFISVFISAISSSSKKALTILVVFWFLSCFVSPKISIDLANNFYPTPSISQFSKGLEEQVALKNDADLWEKKVNAIKARLFKEYKVNDVKKLPVNPDGIVLIENEIDDTRLYKEKTEMLFNSYKNQNDFYLWGSIFSPLVPLQVFSMSLASSDLASFIHFYDSAEEYRTKLVKVMNDEIKNTTNVDDIWSYASSIKTWEKVPPFKYNSPELGFALENSKKVMLILLFWFLLSTLLIYISISKIKV